MKYALGVDGGATKTMAVVGDRTGKVMGVGLAGPTNYQLIGMADAMKHLDDAVSSALSAAGLSVSQIDAATFGIAGADFPVDFDNLTKGISELYPGLDFELTNDTWIGFRAGTEKDYGGVVISGSGANYAAAGPDGRRITGRGMGYEWGCEESAGSLIRHVLHYAFRSHDGTGPKTELENVVLPILGFPTYDDLSFFMYENREAFRVMYLKAVGLVPALFELAFKGDAVSQDILIRTGTTMGEIVGGMMERLGMRAVPADVVLVGSIFMKGVCPLMISALATACQRRVPLATLRPVEMEPAAGALLMALEKLGIDVKGAVRQAVIGSFPDLPVAEV